MLDSPLTRRPEHTATADDAELARVLERYLADAEAGRAPSAAQLQAAHPHLAARLEGCLASLRFLEHAGGEVAQAVGLAPQEDGVRTALGDFRIVREIGRGGMGVVYEAEQLSLGRRVALKVLPFAAMLDQRQLARFKNEARAAASLHHPHIVPVYFVGADRGVHYYAMQYIEGHSLAEVIGETGSLAADVGQSPSAPRSSPASSPRRVGLGRGDGSTLRDAHAAATRIETSSPAHFRRVARLGLQAAQALDFAHQSGVVHRDVKPSNLLLESSHFASRDDVHLWVTDFGLARTGADPALTMTGDLVGTLRYMSPEQISGKTAVLDHRTDVYSLGVTLYELLVRRPAFDGDNAERLLRQVADENPPAPRSLDRSIPADLETIVLKAMRKDPADRYATAQELADDLQRFLDARPIVARRPSARRRIANWIRRNPQLSLAIGVFTVILTLISTLAAWSIDRARRDAAFQRAALLQRDELYRQAETSAEEQVYAMRMHFAGYSAQSSYMEQTAHVLDELKPAPAKPDLRGFEWHYLANLCRDPPQPFGQHQGEAYAASFSPDESRLATAGADGVRIWAWPDRTELKHLRDNRGDVNGIAWSPDGARLASFAADFTARIYRTDDWSLERSLELPGPLVGGRFTPDGQTLLVAERREVVNAAVVGTNRIHLYEAASWAPRGALEAPGEMLQGIAVSPDGQLVAAVAYDSARIWNLPSMRLLHRLPLKKAASVAFAHDSSTLAIGEQGEVRLYDAATGKLLRTIAPMDSPEGLAFGPNDRSLVTVGRTGVAYLWRQASTGAWNGAGAFAQTQPLWGVAVARDGQFVTTDRAGGVWAWDAASSPDARHTIASPEFLERWLADRSPEVRPAADYAASAVRWANAEPAAMGAVAAIAWSRVSDEAAVVSASGHLAIWDGDLREPLAMAATGISGLATLAWSPDGRWLATSTTQSIALIERAALRVVASTAVDRSRVAPLVAFSSDGATLFASWQRPEDWPRRLAAYRVPRLEEAPSGIPQEVRRPQEIALADDRALTRWIEGPSGGRRGPGAAGTAPALATSLDERTVLFAAPGGVIDALHTSPFARKVQIAAGFSGYQPLALSPDGRTLAILDDAGLIDLWSTATGRKLFALNPRLPRTIAIRFSPDGSRLVAVGAGALGNEEFVVWDADPTPP